MKKGTGGIHALPLNTSSSQINIAKFKCTFPLKALIPSRVRYTFSRNGENMLVKGFQYDTIVSTPQKEMRCNKWHYNVD